MRLYISKSEGTPSVFIALHGSGEVLVKYEGELRELVHLLKYEHVRALARPLGAMLASAVELLTKEMAGAGEVLVNFEVGPEVRLCGY